MTPLQLAQDLLILPVTAWGLWGWYAWQRYRGCFDSFLGPEAVRIIRSLEEEPEKWHQFDRYTVDFAHMPIKYSHQAELRLWISSGPKFLTCHGPIECTFSRLERYRIWAAYQRWHDWNRHHHIQQVLDRRA